MYNPGVLIEQDQPALPQEKSWREGRAAEILAKGGANFYMWTGIIICQPLVVLLSNELLEGREPTRIGTYVGLMAMVVKGSTALDDLCVGLRNEALDAEAETTPVSQDRFTSPIFPIRQDVV